jgi:hypothetical protein
VAGKRKISPHLLIPLHAAGGVNMKTATATTEKFWQEMPTRKFVVHLPGLYEDKVDIIEELGNNFATYKVPSKKGADWVDIICLPNYVKTTLEFMKRRVDLPREPGLDPILCCCIWHGLPLIQANETVRALRDLRNSFHDLEQQGNPRFEFVAEYFRQNVRVEISGSKKNIPVPEELKKRIQGTAIDLGVAESTIAILSAMAILSTQESVPLSYREEMSKKVSDFQEVLSMKLEAAQILLARL